MSVATEIPQNGEEEDVPPDVGGLCCCSKGVINSQLRLRDPRRGGRWEIVVTVLVDGGLA